MFKLHDKQQNMLAAAKEFVQGTPITEVINKYNVCYVSVYNAIRRHNLKYDYPGNRSVHFNTRYFQDIDSEHKAYWLGFLFSDGSITKTDKKCSQYNRVQLTLANKDTSMIYLFANDINYPVDKIYKVTDITELQLNSMDTVNDLLALGYTIYKRDRHIPILNDNLMPHFIRGYFDGDGSISLPKGFSIDSGSYNMISEIQDILIKNCNLTRNKISEYRNCYRIRWAGITNLIKLAKYMYPSKTTICLLRKLKKLTDICFHK